MISSFLPFSIVALIMILKLGAVVCYSAPFCFGFGVGA